MKKLIENIAELIKVKTVVTFVVLYVFAKGAATGVISASEVTMIVSIVFTSYFCTQIDKKKYLDANESTPPPVIKVKEKTEDNEDDD